MKLTCILCGGALQFKRDRQTAVCQNCGLEYSLDTLRQRLDADNSPSSEPIPQPDKLTPRPVERIPQPTKPDSPCDGADEEPVFDAAWEPVCDVSAGPALSQDAVLNIWREYLPQAMPQYGFGMQIYDKLKSCYFAPDIPTDCAQRASRYLTKGKVAPQDILGHYSFKPQGGLAGIVVAQDRIFLPVGKLGLEYLEIMYADLLRADVKKEASHKIRTEVKLMTYTNEFTLFYKDGRVETYTANAQYNAAAIVQALNRLIG